MGVFWAGRRSDFSNPMFLDVFEGFRGRVRFPAHGRVSGAAAAPALGLYLKSVWRAVFVRSGRISGAWMLMAQP